MSAGSNRHWRGPPRAFGVPSVLRQSSRDLSSGKLSIGQHLPCYGTLGRSHADLGTWTSIVGSSGSCIECMGVVKHCAQIGWVTTVCTMSACSRDGPLLVFSPQYRTCLVHKKKTTNEASPSKKGLRFLGLLFYSGHWSRTNSHSWSCS